jgi:hypothetical protein
MRPASFRCECLQFVMLTLVYSMQAASLTPLQLQRKMAVKLIAWVAFSRALFCCAPRQSKDATNGQMGRSCEQLSLGFTLGYVVGSGLEG